MDLATVGRQVQNAAALKYVLRNCALIKWHNKEKLRKRENQYLFKYVVIKCLKFVIEGSKLLSLSSHVKYFTEALQLSFKVQCAGFRGTDCQKWNIILTIMFPLV